MNNKKEKLNVAKGQQWGSLHLGCVQPRPDVGQLDLQVMSHEG